MKNIFSFFIAALLLSTAASAQTTVDSIRAKYRLQPMPAAPSADAAFPALGTYQLSGEAGGTVTIMKDSVNKGIVWVEGLPMGTFKAYLKQSPATYRIVGQTTATGKTVAEGTLMLDPATNTLNIAIGKSFNDQNPAEVFALNTAAGVEAAPAEVEVKTKSKAGKTKTKSKQKVVFYTATKVVTTENAVSTTNQQ